MQSKTDLCLFVYYEKGIIFLIYIDNIFYAVYKQNNIDWFYKIINERFETKKFCKFDRKKKILKLYIIKNRKIKKFYID